MKSMNQALFAAVIATTLSLASQASAQYKINEEDGIAASPRLRLQLSEQKASAMASSMAAAKHVSLATTSTGDRTRQQQQIAASPRLRQQLNEARTSAGVPTSVATTAGYQPTGKDGISASPRLRQQLNENQTTLMVAPVK